MKRKLVTVITLALVLMAALIVPSGAQSTTKSLSTNFTLVNLTGTQAQGVVKYWKPDGTSWRADESFTLAANGGQVQYRQYFDNSLSAGQGSVVVETDQAVGAVVQIQARGQNPASYGAYSGLSQGDAQYFVPLAARNRNTLSGFANSQIVVQNASASGNVDFAIDLVDGAGNVTYTKTGTINANGSFLYDLALENPANVPDAWIGSAVVRATNAGGQVAVVSNFFTGDALQTFNAFPSTAPGTEWYIPQFNSRLPNTLSTVIVVQNLSSGPIAAGAISLACTALGGGNPLTVTNPNVLGKSASYSFNPAADTVNFPANYEGSCILTAPANVVSFVQLRFIGTGEAGAYEAFKPGTDKKLIVPLVAKRLANGFSSVVTIQNQNRNTAANVTLTYTPSPTECQGACAPFTVNKQIPAGGNLMQNHGIPSGNNSVPELNDGWQGSLVVTSDQPIVGFVQLRFRRDINPGLPGGDLYMAHNAFTQP